jgi:FKBP-type peptidyl-prolyl cis-trans isomerase
MGCSITGYKSYTDHIICKFKTKTNQSYYTLKVLKRNTKDAQHNTGSTSGSIYYILGQQNGPPGKLPPGWDLTLRGMVVGEKRRITLPYTLAYDRAGSKDKKIPPFSKVIYTVRLVSLT